MAKIKIKQVGGPVRRKQSNANLTDLESRIMRAISDSQFQWRTVQSLARELKEPADVVSKVLTDSDCFIKARNPNGKGQSLYTTSRRYKKQTPFMSRLLNAGANTVVAQTGWRGTSKTTSL